MDVSSALAADIALLTDGLEDAGINLESSLRGLNADAKLAVNSYTGMTMTIELNGHNLALTVHDRAAPPIPATTLLIRLTFTSTDATSTLLLYAATPGAFVDLAADLTHAVGIDRRTLVLDGHLDAAPQPAGITGLAELTAINQAVGVLIARGHTPQTARHELVQLAKTDNSEIFAAAEHVISSTRRDLADDT